MTTLLQSYSSIAIILAKCQGVTFMHSHLGHPVYIYIYTGWAKKKDTFTLVVISSLRLVRFTSNFVS